MSTDALLARAQASGQPAVRIWKSVRWEVSVAFPGGGGACTGRETQAEALRAAEEIVREWEAKCVTRTTR